MNKTKIEWVKNPDGSQGYTWNPITGCLNGCPYCYARKLANGRLKSRYLANKYYPPHLYAADIPVDPFYPRFWEDRLNELPIGYDEPNREKAIRQKARGIFVCDMGDLFGIGVPEEWTREILTAIEDYSFHRFYLLTKQPQNLAKFSPFPDNCWVGVSATDSDMFEIAFRTLMQIQAKVKYISFEPLLDWVRTEGLEKPIKEIDWVIIGAQTNPYKPPKIEWVQEIALACTKAHIPLFLKDNLKPLLPNRMPFWAIYSWTEFDKGVPIEMANNRFRQEMPKEIK